MTRLKSITSAVNIILFGIGLFILNPIDVRAQVTTDRMTCSQVVAAYERNNRIYVRQRSGQILPIYSGVSVSRSRNMRCGRSSGKSGYRVKTLDNKRCVAMYRCN